MKWSILTRMLILRRSNRTFYLLRTLKTERLFGVEKADRLGVVDFLTEDQAALQGIWDTTRRAPPCPITFMGMNKAQH
jgi:hypothetical protein